jgi:hypothetical protein
MLNGGANGRMPWGAEATYISTYSFRDTRAAMAAALRTRGKRGQTKRNPILTLVVRNGGSLDPKPAVLKRRVITNQRWISKSCNERLAKLANVVDVSSGGAILPTCLPIGLLRHSLEEVGMSLAASGNLTTAARKVMHLLDSPIQELLCELERAATKATLEEVRYREGLAHIIDIDVETTMRYSNTECDYCDTNRLQAVLHGFVITAVDQGHFDKTGNRICKCGDAEDSLDHRFRHCRFPLWCAPKHLRSSTAAEHLPNVDLLNEPQRNSFSGKHLRT